MKVVTEGGVEHELLTIPFVFEMTSVTTDTLELTGGAFTVNVAGAEVCPPLDAVIDAVPAAAMRLALTEAVN
jgi:hypothetical protein